MAAFWHSCNMNGLLTKKWFIRDNICCVNVPNQNFTHIQTTYSAGQSGKNGSHGSLANNFLSCIMAEAEVFLMYDRLVPMCVKDNFAADFKL